MFTSIWQVFEAHVAKIFVWSMLSTNILKKNTLLILALKCLYASKASIEVFNEAIYEYFFYLELRMW